MVSFEAGYQVSRTNYEKWGGDELGRTKGTRGDGIEDSLGTGTAKALV